MVALALRNEERIGLGVAVAAHAALVALIVLRPPTRPVIPPPERMTVTLSDEMGPRSTSPEPMAEAAPDTGPEIGEEVLPPPEPIPQPVARPEPPRPAPVATARPQPRPAPPARPQPARQVPQTKPPAKKPAPKQPGSSAFGDAFKQGVPRAQSQGQSRNQGAQTPGAQLVSSWASSINARVARPWNVCAPSGADAEKLRIMVRFMLDRTGGVANMEEPVVTGQTDANRPQVERYKECAVRAIRSSAPFPGLPPEHYDYWKSRRLNFRKE